jgi:hypothetical protein
MARKPDYENPIREMKQGLYDAVLGFRNNSAEYESEDQRNLEKDGALERAQKDIDMTISSAVRQNALNEIDRALASSEITEAAAKQARADVRNKHYFS